MRSRSRSLFALAAIIVPLAAATMLTTGCGKKKVTPGEIRVPRTTLTATGSDKSGATGTETADASGVTPMEYPTGAWAPTGAPEGGSFDSTTSMIPGGPGSFADGGKSALDPSARDAATGDFVNSVAPDGVEDGTFTAELEMIHFVFDSADIAPEFVPVLENHAQWLSQNPAVMVQVEGHCDERGTEEYNISLGQRRADSVRTFLIDKGVAPERLTTISYGKMRPLTFDQNDEAHQLNRRAMFLVYEVPAGGELALAK